MLGSGGYPSRRCVAHVSLVSSQLIIVVHILHLTTLYSALYFRNCAMLTPPDILVSLYAISDISKILTCLNCLNYVLSDLSVYRSFSPFRLNFSNIL